MKAYIRSDDHNPTGLTSIPEGVSTSALKTLRKKSSKAKSMMILALADSALAQARLMTDDDDKSAKELWDELARIYTTSSFQTVQNLIYKLDTLVFDDKKDWNEHVATFLAICVELTAYDHDIPSKDMAEKLLRSFPNALNSVATVS